LLFYQMPTPIKRFLHIHEAQLAKDSRKFGYWIAGSSVLGAMTGPAAPLVVPLLLVTGGLLVTGPTAVGIAKATFWRKDRKSFSKNGKRLLNSEFRNPMDWDCYWTTVVVIGYERTGKTQLKKRLRKMGGEQQIGGLRGSDSPQTIDKEIHLSCVDSAKKAYMALLDHKGVDPSQSDAQEDLIEIAAKAARVIILVLDHADTEKYGDTAALDRDRLKVQKAFIDRSIRFLKENSSKKLRAIMVVMNKADVWEKKQDEVVVRRWTHEQTNTLRRELPALNVQPYFLSAEHEYHSGFADFREKLIGLCLQNDE
jgi:hypothetical protein